MSFAKRISLLLKHDWDRAKGEAQWLSMIEARRQRLEIADCHVYNKLSWGKRYKVRDRVSAILTVIAVGVFGGVGVLIWICRPDILVSVCKLLPDLR